ncbi:hypothetical protein J27TS7_47840 [Paenibacillus dendritiformis]|nr:hypothetical protein J27TS7_47840 [Paenibacillus dendritiformis]
MNTGAGDTAALAEQITRVEGDTAALAGQITRVEGDTAALADQTTRVEGGTAASMEQMKKPSADELSFHPSSALRMINPYLQSSHRDGY